MISTSILILLITFIWKKGTEWTVAGIVASQCGIPILPIGLLKENDHLKLGKFLHKKTCVSDIFHKNNYENIFLLGHQSKFGGLDIFLESHNYKIYNKSNMFNNLKNYRHHGMKDTMITRFLNIQKN